VAVSEGIQDADGTLVVAAGQTGGKTATHIQLSGSNSSGMPYESDKDRLKIKRVRSILLGFAAIFLLCQRRCSWSVGERGADAAWHKVDA
jgi:hypothetical protein